MPTKKVNILAIGAHPGDIELGCAGALEKYIALRNVGIEVNIRFLIMTCEPDKHCSAITITERAEKSADLFGAKLLSFGGLKKGKLWNAKHIADVIGDAMDETDPSIVFTHSGHDRFEDHRSVYKATMSAQTSFLVDAVYCYESPAAVAFCPNHYIKFNSLIMKLKALACHAQILESFFVGTFLQVSPELIQLKARVRAKEACRFLGRYAEAFELS